MASLKCLHFSPLFFTLFLQVLQTAREEGRAHIYDRAAQGKFSLHVRATTRSVLNVVCSASQKWKLLSNIWLLIVPPFHFGIYKILGSDRTVEVLFEILRQEVHWKLPYSKYSFTWPNYYQPYWLFHITKNIFKWWGYSHMDSSWHIEEWHHLFQNKTINGQTQICWLIFDNIFKCKQCVIFIYVTYHGHLQMLSHIKSNQIKSLLLSHHHSTSALVSEILMSMLQTVQKKINKTIYIWRVHIYRLYRRRCAKYTYIYSVHIVYYKDILSYQLHIIHRMYTIYTIHCIHIPYIIHTYSLLQKINLLSL